MSDMRLCVLVFITAFIRDHGYSPTMREIGAGLGLSSPASVYYHIQRLVKSGHIEYVRGSPRTLRVLKVDKL